MPENRIDPLNDSRDRGAWWCIPEQDILNALTDAYHGIQPATVLARLKAQARRDLEQP